MKNGKLTKSEFVLYLLTEDYSSVGSVAHRTLFDCGILEAHLIFAEIKRVRALYTLCDPKPELKDYL